MKSILSVYKPLGLTPLQTVRLLKEQNPTLKKEKVSYAGRLDPLAEGLLLLLIGDENKKRKTYEGLQKTYEFSVLFGVSTDSYDTLGLPSPFSPSPPITTLKKKILTLLPQLVGKMNQPYPPYSSRTVQGKPLYWWAREKKLSEIRIPEKEVEIYSLTLLSEVILPAREVRETIFNRIQLVEGAFRQEEIKTSWESFFNSTLPSHFSLFTFRVSCSSGTYVRSLANDLGKSVGTGALAYQITRINVGNYSVKQAIQLKQP